MNTRLIKVARVAALSILLIAGCSKKKPAAPPPPPPPPAAPTASLSANPTAVEAGQPTQLTWSTENATDVSIQGIGAVSPSGSQSVTPTDSTTYRLVAKGPGGEQEATARVTVNRPAPVAETAPPAPSMTDEQLFQQNVKDAFFDYDSYQLRGPDQQQMSGAAQFLNQHPNWKVRIEGYCDERGSTEYNMALGDSRAQAAKQALSSAGVNASRLSTVSYGKEKPFCNESNEQCWQQNRRAHFVLAR